MKKFYILSAALHKGFIFMAAAAVISVLSLSSCKEEKSEAATVYEMLASVIRNEKSIFYEMLQGTCVSTHVEGHDYLIDPDTGQYKWKDDFNEDINDISNEMWIKFRLDRNNKITILELGDPEDLTLPAVLNYTFNGRQLGGVAFSGDFTQYTNIVEITDTKLVLELDDKGTDENGYNDYYELSTYVKVNE